MPLPYRARAVTACAVLLTTVGLGMPLPASADPDQLGASANSTFASCHETGPALRYIVLFTPGTTQRNAEYDITIQCGTLTVYYPEIGVGIATSSIRDFAARIGIDRAFSAQAQTKARDGKRRQGPSSLATRGTLLVPSRSTRDRSAEQWDMKMLKVDQAHEVSRGTSDVVVGVLDSGVDPNHPDLAGVVDPTLSAGCLTGKPDTRASAWRPTTSPHGTHVAGTIAAADDGKGITGVAPGVRLASVKVVDEEGYIYPEYAVCGYMWTAAKGIRVANSSYFVDPWVFTCRDRTGQRVVHEALRRAVDYATGKGVLSVAAIGNEGVDLANLSRGGQGRLDNSCDVLPAELRGVLAVSSVGAQGVKASHSSYGLGVVDLTAPGGDFRQPVVARSQALREPKPAEEETPAERRAAEENKASCVLSTVPGGGYDRACGTSMATPHVAGVAALLASRNPQASPWQLTRTLYKQADPIACPSDYDQNSDGAQDAICNGYSDYNGFYGHGMVDALDAVTR